MGFFDLFKAKRGGKKKKPPVDLKKRFDLQARSGQGSMSKLKAGDVAMWATTALMDLVGDYAQSTECPLEKYFRDAKIYQIFEGTAQVQRLVISRMQRQEYLNRLQAASEVLEQAPGTAPGSVMAEATKAVSSSA